MTQTNQPGGGGAAPKPPEPTPDDKVIDYLKRARDLLQLVDVDYHYIGFGSDRYEITDEDLEVAKMIQLEELKK